MGIKYRHLSEQDRIEIKRNSFIHSISGLRCYWNQSAQRKYLQRRKRGLRLEKDRELREYVHSKLKAGWSPYQIEGRLRSENSNKCIISHESIYYYIYSD